VEGVRDGRIGRPGSRTPSSMTGDSLLGMQEWKSESGAPWPWRDELEVGCTLEHAGYYVSWLLAMFGPVSRVTAANTLVVPDKGVPATPQQPDLKHRVLEHESGVSRA